MNVSKNRVSIGAVFSVDVLRPAIGGDVIGRLPDGRIVFVRGAAPSDRIAVEITEVKKRFAKGKIIKRTPGDSAVEPFCTAFEECGGCPWQAIPIATQHVSLEAELARRVDRLQRYGKMDVAMGPIKRFSNRAWRSTARVHCRDGVVGFMGYKSHRVIGLETCPVLTPMVDRLFGALKSCVESLSVRTPFVARLTASLGKDSGTVAIDSKVSDKALVILAEALFQIGHVHGVHLGMPNRVVELGECSNMMDPGLAVYPAHGFVQAHQQGNRELVDHVVGLIGPDAAVLELFCGAGNFTFRLLEQGCRVHAIELDASSVERLKQRAAQLGFADQLSARVGNADTLGESLSADVLLVDPPRTGFKNIGAAAQAAGARLLVYVSCDLNTLFRDLENLVIEGWRLESLDGFDLFPHTGHLETVAVLVRSSA
ncbi:MAG: TRAM domain-containing protein [Myxococcota bacterium]|nr:TRAM domain-containing protein [Myxococcota bacterium]